MASDARDVIYNPASLLTITKQMCSNLKVAATSNTGNVNTDTFGLDFGTALPIEIACLLVFLGHTPTYETRQVVPKHSAKFMIEGHPIDFGVGSKYQFTVRMVGSKLTIKRNYLEPLGVTVDEKSGPKNAAKILSYLMFGDTTQFESDDIINIVAFIHGVGTQQELHKIIFGQAWAGLNSLIFPTFTAENEDDHSKSYASEFCHRHMGLLGIDSKKCPQMTKYLCMSYGFTGVPPRENVSASANRVIVESINNQSKIQLKVPSTPVNEYPKKDAGSTGTYGSGEKISIVDYINKIRMTKPSNLKNTTEYYKTLIFIEYAANMLKKNNVRIKTIPANYPIKDFPTYYNGLWNHIAVFPSLKTYGPQ